DKRATDSLASVIDALGSPGSDRHPLRLDNRVALPRLPMPTWFDDSPEPMHIPEADAVMAFATVVTREGRVAGPEPPRADGGRVRDMRRRRDAVSNARFAPAHTGGSPVAVNIVWLVARTAVRGTPRPFDFEEGRPRRPVG